MGVLHMAIPFSPKARPSGLKSAHRRVPRSISHVETGPQALQLINPVPASRGTLPLPVKPLEAKLERTPEQDAANEALAKLVRQCMAGDSQAWQQLVVSQHRRIYAICYRFTGSGSDAKGCEEGATWRGAPTGCSGPRQHRLGQDLHRREGRRGQKLFCRAKLGTHAAECCVSQDSEGVNAAGWLSASYWRRYSPVSVRRSFAP